MTRPGQPPEPAWWKPCRAELLKLRHGPAFVVVFDIRWRVYEGNCTAEQLAQYLADGKRGFEWAPTARTLRRWLAVILPVETRHMSRSEDYQRAETDTGVR